MLGQKITMSIKIILTGATGFVGEGVLLECLRNPHVSEILMVNRRHIPMSHPKLKELLLPDFTDTTGVEYRLSGYDACFYCAGISSVGMGEEAYTRITYHTTLDFAKTLKVLNPDMVFNFVSGGNTDSTEQGKVMWARVKGRTENALQELLPDKQYNFRPSLMKPSEGQKNFRGYNRYVKMVYPVLSLFFPTCSLEEIGKAMIRAAEAGYEKNILEVKDIKILANRG